MLGFVVGWCERGGFGVLDTGDFLFAGGFWLPLRAGVVFGVVFSGFCGRIGVACLALAWCFWVGFCLVIWWFLNAGFGYRWGGLVGISGRGLRVLVVLELVFLGCFWVCCGLIWVFLSILFWCGVGVI